MTKMTMKAEAIWNDDHWEVSMSDTYYSNDNPDRIISTHNTCKNNVFVCDEFVFPWAILKAHGIDVNFVNPDIERPLEELI